MRKITVLILCLFLTGCVTHTDIVPLGSDTFMISRGGATGFSDFETLKTEAFQEANQYCTTKNKNIRVINTTESSPPYIMGNFPRVKIQFMCLEKNTDHSK